MNNFREIKKWKRIARAAYITIHERDHTCGISLSAEISPRIHKAVTDLDMAMAKLKELDPKFPIGATND